MCETSSACPVSRTRLKRQQVDRRYATFNGCDRSQLEDALRTVQSSAHRLFVFGLLLNKALEFRLRVFLRFKKRRDAVNRPLEAAYDPEHTNVMHFHRARNAGEQNLMGISQQQAQSNFDLRIEAFAAVLRSTIKQLKLQLPEELIKGVYDVGDEYGFYADLSKLIASAATDVLIVDAYLSRKVFDLYVADVP